MAKNYLKVPILATISDVKNFISDIRDGRLKNNLNGGWTAIIRRLDPDMAKFLLERGIDNNRLIKPHHVRNMVESMNDDSFHTILVTIKLDSNGMLADGQHRLVALRAAEVTLYDVPLIVMADDEALGYVDDGGQPRSITDVRKITGKETLITNIISAVTLERNDFKYSERQSNRIKSDAADASRFLPMLKEIQAVDKRVISGVLAAAIRCARVNEEYSRDFFKAVVDPKNTAATVYGVHEPGIVKLRDRLNGMKSDKVRGFQRQWNAAAYSVVAFTAWFNEKKIGRLKLPGVGKFPAFGRDRWAIDAKHDPWFVRKPTIESRIASETRWYKSLLKNKKVA